MSDWDDQADVFKDIYRQRGRVDVVCVNAGVSGEEDLIERDEDEEPVCPGMRSLDVNLLGSLYSKFHIPLTNDVILKKKTKTENSC